MTIDFAGTIDGVPFDGGKAEDFQFVIGEGQMLEQFDSAVRGMKAGESKTFPLQFPADYQGKDVAGKEADFTVTLKKIEAPAPARRSTRRSPRRSASAAARRGAARRRPQEPRARGQVPRPGAQQGERDGRAGQGRPSSRCRSRWSPARPSGWSRPMRADLKKRGVKDAETAPIPAEMFQAQAERRVRLGLVVAELVRSQNLQAKPEQLQAHIEELAQSYEKPAEVVRWYLSDRSAWPRSRRWWSRTTSPSACSSKAKVDRQGACRSTS